jgi:hypothetical protein
VTKQLATSTTMLSYAMTTTPNPVEVSTSPTSPALANLIFVVSCPRSVGSCTVSQITVALPVGAVSDATNLTNVAPSASAATISSSDGTAWTPSLGVAAGLFVFSPPGGSVQISEQSLTILIAGIQVSPMVGTADITFHEWAAPGAYPPPTPHDPPSGTAVIQVSKFPSGFYVSDFAANVPQVSSGGTATLTWIGSDNADYSIAYADQPPKPVTGRTWYSPPLYTTTVFILTASATSAGQTVSMSLSTTVVVATPQVVEFYPDPSSIDYQQTITLHWRAVNADGVYLLTGQTQKQTLGPVSDSSHPVTLQPSYGGVYAMQAFKNVGQTQELSAVVPLSYTFNAIVIQDFSANPTTVDLNHTSTTLSWNVLHAKSVSYQGRTVPAQGNSVEKPGSDATYNLVATWVDGSQVQATPVHVKVLNVQFEGVSVDFSQSGTTVTTTIHFTTANTTAVSVSNAYMMFSSTHHWYIWGNHWQSPAQNGSAQQVDATHWQVKFTFANIDGNAIKYPNAGLAFTYHGDGYNPVTSGNTIIMWRGQFNFWNGS